MASLAKRALVLSKLLDHSKATLRLREQHVGWAEANCQKWRDQVEVIDELLHETVAKINALQEERSKRGST